MFIFSSALSLLLCVFTCAIWARSHWVSDEVKYAWTRGVVWGWTPSGSLEVGLFLGDCSGEPANFYGLRHEPSPIIGPMDTFSYLEIDPPDRLIERRWGGFAYYRVHHRTTSDVQAEVVAPFWAIACLTALLPATWVALRLRSRLRDRRWSRNGFCSACGYDMRATPASCPECGAEGSRVPVASGGA